MNKHLQTGMNEFALHGQTSGIVGQAQALARREPLHNEPTAKYWHPATQELFEEMKGFRFDLRGPDFQESQKIMNAIKSLWTLCALRTLVEIDKELTGSGKPGLQEITDFRNVLALSTDESGNPVTMESIDKALEWAAFEAGRIARIARDYRGDTPPMVRMYDPKVAEAVRETGRASIRASFSQFAERHVLPLGHTPVPTDARDGVVRKQAFGVRLEERLGHSLDSIKPASESVERFYERVAEFLFGDKVEKHHAWDAVRARQRQMIYKGRDMLHPDAPLEAQLKHWIESLLANYACFHAQLICMPDSSPDLWTRLSNMSHTITASVTSYRQYLLALKEYGHGVEAATVLSTTENFVRGVESGLEFSRDAEVGMSTRFTFTASVVQTEIFRMAVAVAMSPVKYTQDQQVAATLAWCMKHLTFLHGMFVAGKWEDSMTNTFVEVLTSLKACGIPDDPLDELEKMLTPAGQVTAVKLRTTVTRTDFDARPVYNVFWQDYLNAVIYGRECTMAAYRPRHDVLVIGMSNKPQMAIRQSVAEYDQSKLKELLRMYCAARVFERTHRNINTQMADSIDMKLACFNSDLSAAIAAMKDYLRGKKTGSSSGPLLEKIGESIRDRIKALEAQGCMLSLVGAPPLETILFSPILLEAFRVIATCTGESSELKSEAGRDRSWFLIDAMNFMLQHYTHFDDGTWTDALTEGFVNRVQAMAKYHVKADPINSLFD